MPPKMKFTQDEIVQAALSIARESGLDAVTTRDLGAKLGVSTRPIFTCFHGIHEVHAAVREKALSLYRRRVEEGFRQPVSFLGMGMAHIRFAREEPELYRLLFLPRHADSAVQAMQQALALIRPSIEQIYRMDAETADWYFRSMWLSVHGLATLIVTGCCPYSDQEISSMLTALSLSLCKAIKELPGLVQNRFDRDAEFCALVSDR